MKKIRFVFFIAQFEWRNAFTKGKKIHLIDDIISWWTLPFNWWTPGYSHMSVWIPRDNGGQFMGLRDLIDHVEDSFFGDCYTSTMRGDDNGTVSRPASGVFKHPERWHYIEFEVTDESLEKAKAWADERVKNNKGYSMRDLWRFVMPLWILKKLKIADPDREICSEHGEGWAIRLLLSLPLVEGRLYSYYLLSEILIRSPRRLWRDLVRRERVPTYSLATSKMVYNEKGKKI